MKRQHKLSHAKRKQLRAASRRRDDWGYFVRQCRSGQPKLIL
jgi:hypothetical protein